MNGITRSLKLVGAIARHGRFRHSGYDFTREREEQLRQLSAEASHEPLSESRNVRANLYWHNIIAQAAYVKSRMFANGGHLMGAGNLAYIRIPKSANTSLSLIMLQSQGIPNLSTATSEQINFLADRRLESHIQKSSGITFFTVVRDPFERIVSVYLDFFQRHANPFLYEDYLFGIFHRSMTFSEFIDRLILIPDWLKDPHLRPQHAFLRYYQRKNIQPIVLRLEETSPLTEFLSNHGLSLPRLNAAAPYDYRSYYSADSFHKVAAIYEKDVAQFGYEKEQASLNKFLQA
jgi:hypothetical protein